MRSPPPAVWPAAAVLALIGFTQILFMATATTLQTGRPRPPGAAADGQRPADITSSA